MKRPPQHLSEEAAGWWLRLTDEFALDDPAAELLLLSAMESFDRLRQLQDLITKQGAFFKDRFGQAKANPLLASERDSRAQMLAALKQLNLDVDPTGGNVGRPPGR